MSNINQVLMRCDDAAMVTLHAKQVLTNARGTSTPKPYPYPTMEDKMVFDSVERATQKFDVTNGAVKEISTAGDLLTFDPLVDKIERACSQAEAVAYKTFVGMFGVLIKDTIVNGSVESFKASKLLNIIDGNYPLYVKYTNADLNADIGLSVDVSDISPLGTDTAVAFAFVDSKSAVINAVNDNYLLEANSDLTISQISLKEGVDVDGTQTTVVEFRILD